MDAATNSFEFNYHAGEEVAKDEGCFTGLVAFAKRFASENRQNVSTSGNNSGSKIGFNKVVAAVKPTDWVYQA